MSRMMDYEYDNGAVYDYEYRSGDYRDSDEDTEDASETGSFKHEYMDDYDLSTGGGSSNMELIYRDHMRQLRSELEELDTERHPGYLAGMADLDEAFNERRLYIECCFKWQQERIEHDYMTEEQSALQEYNDRRIELKENLIADLEEKKRMFEADALDLTSDAAEPKLVTTRKLRRRPNDPIPMPDRRRRASPAHINYQLDEGEINEDLKLIAKFASGGSGGSGKGSSSSSKGDGGGAGGSRGSTGGGSGGGSGGCGGGNTYDSYYSDARIEDNKLFYDKRWYHRGQNVFLESAEGVKTSGLILQIGASDIYVRKAGETKKTAISLEDLLSRKFIIQRRSS